MPIQEDDSIGRADAAADAGPVMLELPPNVYDAYTSGASSAPITVGSELEEARTIFVRTIPPKEQDWITKSASLIRCVVHLVLRMECHLISCYGGLQYGNIVIYDAVPHGIEYCLYILHQP